MRFLQVAAVATALATFGMAVPSAWSATETPYTEQAFQAAQEAGMPIVIHVTAPWCPTCAKQKPILSRLEAEPQFAKLQVFDVDFDSQKDLLRTLGVQMQSTLIAYHGKSERGRSTGVVDEGKLKDLLSQANG